VNAEVLEKIVNAVLYEGYILYPYRPSSVKNQQRWTFGGLYPEACHWVEDNSESCVMQTQCIVEGSDATVLNISVRFLHLVTRTVGELLAGSAQSRVGVPAHHPVDETKSKRWASTPTLRNDSALQRTPLFPSPGTPGEGKGGGSNAETHPDASQCSKPNSPPSQPSTGVAGEGKNGGISGEEAVPRYRPVDSLRVGDKVYQSWEEATERAVIVPPIKLGGLCRRSVTHSFAFPDGSTTELLRNDDRKIAGVLIRHCKALVGDIELSAEKKSDDAYLITIRVVNRSAMPDPESATRQEAQIYSLASTHTIINVENGALVSAIDPPERFGALQKECIGKGSWPVLVGQAPQRDTMLASPIILYDYPQIAPESQGNLFDSTEIDEILSLRIMTLTDAEKQAIGGADERARSLLQRTDALGREQMASLHGTVRGLKTISSGDAAHD
jgi:hypothetical protein